MKFLVHKSTFWQIKKNNNCLQFCFLIQLRFFSYRYLLDTWKMFYERADFDIMLAQFKPNEKPPRQVYISCSFCGKSISAYLAALNRGRGQFQRMTGTANKVRLIKLRHLIIYSCYLQNLIANNVGK